jgi:predicted metal-dependent hydrolase
MEVVGVRAGTKSAAALAEALRRASVLALGAPVAIRIDARARRLLLRVDASMRRIELVLPRGVSAEAGLNFLEAQRGWVDARLRALPPAMPFTDDAIVPVFGVPHRIRCCDDPGGPPVMIIDGQIRVRGRPEHVGRRVRDYLLRLARSELSRRARLCALSVGKPIAGVAVRDTKSRWGSCSGQGRISFSWRLVMAPEAVVDYVVAHEVAHLIEMNHGPRFWGLLRTLVPDDAAPRAWLKRNRNRLFAYG